MIGRLHHMIFDCADPAGAARFWSAVLGHPIVFTSEDFVVVAESGAASGLAFQLAPDHRAPTWPDPAVPQQAHVDVMVADVGQASSQVMALGARKLDDRGAFADPAGHPFCLVPLPSWAVHQAGRSTKDAV